MVDVDPRIWDNPTLGEAVNLPFLDELEAQQMEDYAARVEGRPARRVMHYPRKHEYMPGEETVNSNITQIVYVDVDGDGDLDRVIVPKKATNDSKSAVKNSDS
jgi:hypothetical protein